MTDALENPVSSVEDKRTSATLLSRLLNAKTLSLLVLFVAIVISGYLSYLKLAPQQEAVCVSGDSFDCGVVLNSIYSEIQGVPIAYLGLATNLIIVALLVLEGAVPFLRTYGPFLVFGVVLFAFVFSVYLVYVQAALLRSYCPWCLTHEALITVLFVLSGWRLLNWSSKDELEDA